MKATRLEAYSDAVIAIIITIMVLELHVPEEASLAALAEVLPTFLAYVLSFIYLSIYWNNHHHLLHACDRINGRAMWANIHLLFWLSLVPFSTAWLSQNPGTALTSAVYGINLFMAGLAYYLLTRSLKPIHEPDSRLNSMTASATKEHASTALYLAAIGASLLGWVAAAYALYVLVALMWVIPDRRYEALLQTLMTRSPK